MLRRARCRGEVVLSAGAIGSPQIMLLSGVGPAAQLQRHGIPVVLDRPGVGENLHDHLQVRLIYRVSGVKTLNAMYHSVWGRAGIYANYALFRRGPLTMAPAQLGLFTRSDPTRDRANLQFHVQRCRSTAGASRCTRFLPSR
jgi:choline dehydrogenase-like flavoprotein